VAVVGSLDRTERATGIVESLDTGGSSVFVISGWDLMKFQRFKIL